MSTKKRTRRGSPTHDMEDADEESDEELVVADNADALERRMEEGMEVDAVDGNGYTLLHYAAGNGSVKCLRV
jgi:hypothetical protein